MTKTKQEGMPISVTERKKAEELILSKFENLRQALRSEVTDKKNELNATWSQRIGLAKLQKQLEKAQEKVKEIEDKIDDLTSDHYANATHRKPKATGPLRLALQKIESAERTALGMLDEKELETREKLWLGMLASDALGLLKGIPTFSDIKKNGLSMLGMSSKKLLDTGK